MVVDVVQNPQKSNVYEYEKKHVRCVAVYSGIIYGCVRYLLPAIPVGGTDRSLYKKAKNVICEYNRLNG